MMDCPTEQLLNAWDSPETEEYVICRGIDPWKWRCYALAAGAVDGRKWKGAEIARERKLSRARICVVLKEVERKLTSVRIPDPRRELFARLRKCDLRNAASVRGAFGLNGGRKAEFGCCCYPDIVNSVFIAEGREWFCEEVIAWGDLKRKPVFVLCCSRTRGGSPSAAGALDFPGINANPIVVNCEGRLFALDRMVSVARLARIRLKPLE